MKPLPPDSIDAATKTENANQATLWPTAQATLRPTAPHGFGTAFAAAAGPARAPLQIGLPKAAPPIDSQTLLKVSDLEVGTAVAPAQNQVAASGNTSIQLPRTVNHSKYEAVDLVAIAKNIPGATYLDETYSSGEKAQVIRSRDDKVIIRKSVENGNNIIESYMQPSELAYAFRNLSKGQLALVTDVLNGQVGTMSPKTFAVDRYY